MLYKILRYTVAPIVKVLFLVKMKNRKNIPKRDGAVLAMNHTVYFDPVFLSLVTHRNIFFIANSKLFKPPEIIRFVLRGTSCLPSECGRFNSEEILDKCVKRVKEGDLFGIFPEGIAKGEEKILKGYTGVAELALKAHAPIIPIAIINAHGTFPPRSLIPRKLKTIMLAIKIKQ